jgi:hypothetical protein
MQFEAILPLAKLDKYSQPSETVIGFFRA